MKPPATRCKCPHCKKFVVPDYRNRGRQRFCSYSECQTASKRTSQARWLGKAENRDYFRGSENVKRVQKLRAEHPGYWQRRARMPRPALQEACSGQALEQDGRAVALRDVKDLRFGEAGTVRVVLAKERWKQRRQQGDRYTRVACQSQWRWMVPGELDGSAAAVIWAIGATALGRGEPRVQQTDAALSSDALSAPRAGGNSGVAGVCWGIDALQEKTGALPVNRIYRQTCVLSRIFAHPRE